MIRVFGDPVRAIHVGSLDDCASFSLPDWSIVHALKSPCYMDSVAFAAVSDHRGKYVIEYDRDLYVNVIDPPAERPFFYPELFTLTNDFLGRNADRDVLIHCNKGESRAPSFALVYLAHCGLLPTDSYAEARRVFSESYPAYAPGGGIERYLTEHWGEII
jgi:hypothetical protein